MLVVGPAQRADAEDLQSLRVLGPEYPRAFFFRASESLAANARMPYDRWDACFSRLMGIEGKVLEEEIPGRSIRNVDAFTRFKQRHPEQLVLLHYNGNARDPRYQREAYFAGHFLYFNGAKILDDVPAEAGQTEIRVADASLFRTGVGRYRWSNDDVGLCALDADGKPNWHESEQAQLISVDPRRGVIRVKRGCYGTAPRAFRAGQSYAAAHVTEGPWGRISNLLWYYNHATVCPRDRNGRTSSQIHVEELAGRFLPGGELEVFAGLEFDVLHHEVGSRGGKFGVDCNADGEIDNGVVDGLNVYGIGVVELCRALREKLGPNRLILADGMGLRNQRALRILNGIESEGWPTLSDWEIRDWSGGLNRHFFWAANAHPPVFNYVNHKFTTAGDAPGSRKVPEVPLSVHRLVFAAATFTDSAVCYSFAAPKRPDEVFGIWDELRKGTENELGWLGRPLGPAVRLASSRADLLEGGGEVIGPPLAERFVGEGIAFSPGENGLKIEAVDRGAGSLRFRLCSVPCDGPDLFVSVVADAAPRAGYPPEIPRMTWVGIAPPEGQLVRKEPPAVGMCLREGQETRITPESGASVRWMPARSLGGETHDCYMVHPPYKESVGYAFWEREAHVPEDGSLELFTGMGEKSPTRSDGVTFRVLAAEAKAGGPAAYRPLLEQSQVESKWVRHQVSLADWAGRRVRLRFVSDCGPGDNSTTDHSYWGDVCVSTPDRREGLTEPVRHMTWVNDRAFTSGFYFHDVRSGSIDLEFEVEGSEPMRIEAIRAAAYPDVIYRPFQRGLVLANPSPRPFEFDLPRLVPGRRFRRLRGSAEQDPIANDGSPVAGRITLGPQEGLFLVEEPRDAQ
jgi:hypothetical protein